MPRLCLFSFFFAAFLAITCAQGQRTETDQGILNGFPGFHLLAVQERDADAKAFILAHFPKHNPSLVHADVDGDGNFDWAVLLKADNSEAARFVILLCSADGHCKKALEENITPYAGEVYIRPVATGRRVSQTAAIDTKNNSSPVRLRSIGIELSYFGKAKVVYFWNPKHKKIETLQTED
jgi:hypothetical protein